MNIGVLALQGAFVEHEKMLSELGIASFEIRQRRDLCRSADGLIIPGGESTVQGKLLRELGLFEPIQTQIQNGFPVFGTCAGLLLLAKKIENDSRTHFATMNIVAVRNAYGRQLGSFYTEDLFCGKRIPMVFIRAPYILSAEGTAKALARVNGRIVAARDENQLVTAFHPELSGNITVHQYFADMIIHHGRMDSVDMKGAHTCN